MRDAWRRLRGGEVTPWRAALSVGVGLAIGVTPLWGLHWLIVLALCVPLRLDAPVAFVASNISLPFVAPALTLAEIEIGAGLLKGRLLALDLDTVRAQGAAGFAGELALGVAVTAVGLGLAGGAIAYAVVAVRRRSSPAES